MLLASACGQPPPESMPAKGEKGVRVVVETPVGAVHVVRYDPGSLSFVTDSSKLAFLPFPANWGFVPSTRMPYQEGRGFAPVQILVLGERLETGDMVEVRPVGAVILSEKGKNRILVVSVPVDPALCNLVIEDYSDLLLKYPGVKESLEQWLRQWKGGPPARVMDWKDGQYATRFIHASMPKKKEEAKNN